MPSQDDPVQVYKELADWYERRGEPPMRDRFFVLAADAALRAGRVEDADRIRLRLLKMNPHHMLKPYTSFTQAMQGPDVQTYVRDLRLNYPPEVALVLLHSLRTTGMKLDATAPPAPDRLPDDDATVSLGDPTEPLRMFPDQSETDAPETAAIPKHVLDAVHRPLAQPKPPPSPSRPAGSSANVPRPQPAPLPAKKKSTATPRPQVFADESPYMPPPSDPETAVSGGWFAVLLFILVCLSGLALVGYLVARPFLS